ncbi:MAG: hypothetical protein ABEJ03_02320 [Candidatus Nanohaloarchaea archaeon]
MDKDHDYIVYGIDFNRNYVRFTVYGVVDQDGVKAPEDKHKMLARQVCRTYTGSDKQILMKEPEEDGEERHPYGGEIRFR